MQRILSVEASRNSTVTSEFVTKRLCCSFLLSVAFFAIIGGFFLGRFANERPMQQMKNEIKHEISEISKKLMTLDKNLKDAFHSGNCSCSTFNTVSTNCKPFTMSSEEPSAKNIKETLDSLNNCFNNG